MKKKIRLFFIVVLAGPSVPAFIEANLLDVLGNFLDSERISVEVKCNALSLIGFLTQSGKKRTLYFCDGFRLISEESRGEEEPETLISFVFRCLLPN